MGGLVLFPAICLATAKAEAEDKCVEIASAAADVARATAPRDTGHFAASISSSGRQIINSDEAAGYIELGTSDTPAHMTMINAARQFGRYVGTS